MAAEMAQDNNEKLIVDLHIYCLGNCGPPGKRMVHAGASDFQCADDTGRMQTKINGRLAESKLRCNAFE